MSLQPSWLRIKEFWDKTFEERYEDFRNDSRRPKLKVYIFMLNLFLVLLPKSREQCKEAARLARLLSIDLNSITMNIFGIFITEP